MDTENNVVEQIENNNIPIDKVEHPQTLLSEGDNMNEIIDNADNETVEENVENIREKESETADEKGEAEATEELTESAIEENVEDIREKESETVDEKGEAEATEELIEPAVEEKVKKRKISPEKKRKILIICGVAFAVLLIALAIVYFAIIRPEGIYRDALTALENKEFSKCQQLIDSIPNYRKTPDLQDDLTIAMATEYLEKGKLDQAEALLMDILGNPEADALSDEITYQRADAAISDGELKDARELLEKIPEHEKYEELCNKLKYAEADAARESGDYKTAYDLFAGLGSYKDAEEQAKTTYYEALAFRSLLVIRESLKDPTSMRINKVTFYKNVLTTNELDLLADINAANSFGGSIGGYAYDEEVYSGNQDAGLISFASYNDPDSYTDLIQKIIVLGICSQSTYSVSIDVARMNRLLKADVVFNVNLRFSTSQTF